MHSNPLRHKGVGGAGGAAGSEGEVVMPRPRVRDDYDGRPIEERLGDLAESLNKECVTLSINHPRLTDSHTLVPNHPSTQSRVFPPPPRLSSPLSPTLASLMVSRVLVR
jgi:hypothetical protein